MHFKLIDKISSGIPFKLLNSLVNSRIFPIVYHTVGEVATMPYLQGLYHVPSGEDFEKDIDFLLKNYKPVGLKEISDFIKTGYLPGNGPFFFLSFDDGLKTCYDHAEPILRRKGVQATFFVNTAFVGNTGFLHRFKVVLLSQAIKADKSDSLKQKTEEFFNLSFTCRYKAAKHVYTFRYPQVGQLNQFIRFCGLDIDEALQGYAPYMSKSELLALAEKGHLIGAHSAEHPEFYLIPEEQQLEQAVRSIEQVDEWFKPEIRSFAFPFTDDGVKKSFFDKLREKTHVDITFGSAGLKRDMLPYHFHRIGMDDTGLRAEDRLKSELLYYMLKKPLGKNTLRRL